MPTNFLPVASEEAQHVTEHLEEMLDVTVTRTEPTIDQAPPRSPGYQILFRLAPTGAYLALSGATDRLADRLESEARGREVIERLIGEAISAMSQPILVERLEEVDAISVGEGPFAAFPFRIDDPQIEGQVWLPAPQPNDEPTHAASAGDGSRQSVSRPSFADLGPENISEDRTREPDLTLLSDVELEITVELGRRKMPIFDLLNLESGSVIEVDKLVGEPLELYANGSLIAEGEAVVIDEQFGVRITKLTSEKQRRNILK